MSSLFKTSVAGLLVALIFTNCADENVPRGRMDPQRQVQRLAKRLDLDDQQQADIENILREQREKFAQLREEYSGESSDMREAMNELRAETDEKIEAVLTEEQKEDYRSMQAERREPRRRPREQQD